MDTLRPAVAAGLKVQDARVPSRAGAFTPVGIMWHYTATPPRGRNLPTLNVVRDGRSDLPGPLCHYLLGRDGTVAVITTGKANHAGAGSQRVLDSVRANRPPPSPGGTQVGGNTWFVGVEMEADASSDYTDAQRSAGLKLAVSLSRAMDVGHNTHIGHQEWTTRKGDPGPAWPMGPFRRQIQTALAGTTNQEVDVTQAEIDAIVKQTTLNVLQGLVGDPNDPADGYGEAAEEGSRTALGIRVAKVIQDEHAKTRARLDKIDAKLDKLAR